MAIHEATIHPFPAQGRVSLVITSEQISRYAEVSALVNRLEADQKKQRLELLALRAAGARQSSDAPYILGFVDQDRRNVDWEALAIGLAEKLFGVEGAVSWKDQAEQSASILPITQIRVKPNPEYAAGLVMTAMPPAPVMTAAFGD